MSALTNGPQLPGSELPADGPFPYAHIYRPAPPATQSGRRHKAEWVLEFEPASRREIEPLMGWTATRDPFGSLLCLRFPDRWSAIDFAARHGWRYVVHEPLPRRFHPKNYADNFKRAPEDC